MKHSTFKLLLLPLTAAFSSFAQSEDQTIYSVPGSGRPLPPGYVIVTCAVPASVAASMQPLPPPADAPEPAAVPVPAPELAAAAPEKKAPPRDWKVSAYGGLSVKSGNSSEVSYNYGGEYERKNGSLYRYRLKADGRYSQAEEQVTTSKAEVSGEMRRRVSERWFVSGRMALLHDDIRKIDYRSRTGPGIGLYLADSKTMQADVSTGLHYVREESANEESGYVAWSLSQRLDWQMTQTIKLWTETDFYLSLMETAHYQVTFRSGLENKLSDHLSLVIGLMDDFDSLPERNGNIQKNDVEISTSLRYNL